MPAAAADVVLIASTSRAEGQLSLSGTVVEYTGTELVLKLPSGNEQKFAARQVLDVRPEPSADQQTADKLMGEHEYAAAAAQYDRAIPRDSRRWVRRLLLSRAVVCRQRSGQYGAAGDYFLQLLKSDPQTPYFDSIPLPWLAVSMTPELEQRAMNWINQADSPVAQLLGASYLLSGDGQATALVRLRQLTDNPDRRIALLAEAQQWRVTYPTASPTALSQWNDRLEQLSGPLRAGPEFTVGRALVQRDQHEAGVLALLRVAITNRDDRPLAAESLWLAGRALEKMSQPADAARLYRELVQSFPEASSVDLAQDRLRELAAGASPTAPANTNPRP